MGNEKWFGRTFETIGNIEKDFLIKTRGLVKVLYNKKFIDIIKDGKLNVECISILKRVQNVSEINDDGIYYCEDDGSVYIQIGDILIKITDGSNSTYVSYLIKQNTTSDLKFTAQQNIGLVFNNLIDALDIIVNGFVYIINEEAFYTVSNGKFTKLQFEIPNPYPKLFVIQRQDGASGGALKLEGTGLLNGITISSSTNIYDLFGDTIILNTFGKVIISQNDKYTFIIDSKGITSSVDITNYGDFIGDDIHSENFKKGELGYRLYYDTSTGKSILEVDRVIERDAYNLNKIIRTYSEGGIISEATIEDTFNFTLLTISTLKVGDLIEVQPFCDIEFEYQDKNGILQKDSTSLKIPIQFQIYEIEDYLNIKTKLYPDNSVLEEVGDNYILHSQELGDLTILIEEDGFLEDLFTQVNFYRVALLGNPKDATTWLETFCTDYINDTLSLQRNYTEIVNNKFVVHINKNTILGNIKEVIETAEPHIENFNLGLYSNLPVFNGGVFRLPEGNYYLEGEVQDVDIWNYPRFSHTLDDMLCTHHLIVPDGDEFEHVIPTIKWVKLLASKLNIPLSDINDAELGSPPSPLYDDLGNEIPVAIVHKDGKWQYMQVAPYSLFKILWDEVKNSLTKHTVYWYINEDDEEPYTTTITYNNSQATKPTNDPIKKHYKFEGWNYNNEPITEDTKIYAKWKYISPEVFIGVNPKFIVSQGQDNVEVTYWAKWLDENSNTTEGIIVEGTYTNIDYQEVGTALIVNGKIVRTLKIKENTQYKFGEIHFIAKFEGLEEDIVTSEALLKQYPKGSAVDVPDFNLMKLSTEWTNISTEDMYGKDGWSSIEDGVWKYNSIGDLDILVYLKYTDIVLYNDLKLDDYEVGYLMSTGRKYFIYTNDPNTDVGLSSKIEIRVCKSNTYIKYFNTSSSGILLDRNTLEDFRKANYDANQYITWSGDNRSSSDKPGGEYVVINFKKIINEFLENHKDLSTIEHKAIFVYVEAIWAASSNGTNKFDLAYDLYSLLDETNGLISKQGEYNFELEDINKVKLVKSDKLVNLEAGLYPSGLYTKRENYKKVATLYYDLNSKEMNLLPGEFTESDIYEASNAASGNFVWNDGEE